MWCLHFHDLLNESVYTGILSEQQTRPGAAERLCRGTKIGALFNMGTSKGWKQGGKYHFETSYRRIWLIGDHFRHLHMVPDKYLHGNDLILICEPTEQAYFLKVF